MKKQTGYADKPIELEVVKDFLPPPGKLVLRDETVKVTIQLSRPSVDFFKRKARQHHVPYQKMIRRVIDLYAESFE